MRIASLRNYRRITRDQSVFKAGRLRTISKPRNALCSSCLKVKKQRSLQKRVEIAEGQGIIITYSSIIYVHETSSQGSQVKGSLRIICINFHWVDVTLIKGMNVNSDFLYELMWRTVSDVGD